MIERLLIANRGEIAARIARTARRMGISTVAVHSAADAGAFHLRAADLAVPLAGARPADGYLDPERLVAAALETGADAVHPGYGFLSENAGFAEAVTAAGLTWVGPPPGAIRAMGLKDAAKRRMEEVGVPVVPGYHGADQDPERLSAEAARIGYPVLIKAAAGGGGKGMRRVDRAEDFDEALARARSEAEAAFANPAVLVERCLEAPRHIEVQVFADSLGGVVHLYERDCSLQRRHQKVVEEAPAPGMTPALRGAMTDAALRAARAVGYVGAGTVEFIVDGKRMTPDAFYFLEMNTRLQVEHPVTEAVTGVDLVAWQLRVAAGEPLPLRQEEIPLRGHAVEARLYAEDPAAGFAPRTGRIAALRWPEALRVDAGVAEGWQVRAHYDPMVAKLVAHGPSRAAALDRLADGLAQTDIAGLTTNLGFLQRLLQAPAFRAGRPDTGLIGQGLGPLTDADMPVPMELAVAAAALSGLIEPDRAAFWRPWGPARAHLTLASEVGQHPVSLRTDRREGATAIEAETAAGPVALRLSHLRGALWRVGIGAGPEADLALHRDEGGVTLARRGRRLRLSLVDPAARGAEEAAAGGDSVRAPLPGLVKSVAVQPGEAVRAGAPLAVLEAMKMEHSLAAPRDGRVAAVHARAGEPVEDGTVLVTLEPEESP